MRRHNCSLPIAIFVGTLVIAVIGCPSARGQSFAYVPNGTSISVIDMGTNSVVATMSTGSSFGVAVTPNGSFAYVTNFQNGTVSVIDRTNTVVATIPGFSTPFSIAITPNGAFAYVANFGGDSVGVINTAANALVATVSLPANSNPTGVAITPDGSLVYVSDQGSNAVSVIRTATNSVIATVPVGANPAYLTVTPDGALVYVPNFGSATVSVINTATNLVVATVPVGTRPVGVAVRPDGAIAYVTNRDDNTVLAIRTATNTVLSVTSVGNGPVGVAITADGAFAYVVNQFGGTVSVIETASNTVVATIPVVSGAQVIAISPADNDSQLAQLNGGNTLSGNQTINGSVTANSFVGNGSGLTGVNAQTAATANGLNCQGCVGNTQLSINYAAGDTQGGNALNSLMFGGLLPSAFAPAAGSPNYAPTSGSASYVAKSGDTMTGTLNLPSNGLVAGGNQLVLSGGNVGIGTATPEAVSGYTSLHIDNSGAGFGGGFLELTHSATGAKGRVVMDDNGFLLHALNSEPVKIKSGNFNGGSDPGHIYIAVNGNVGLSTNNPAATLEVNGTAKFDGPVTFAPGQTFPGAGNGTITGVTAGTGLSGGGTSGNVTLNNTGVLNLTAGTGITSSGGPTPMLTLNTGFTDLRYPQLSGNNNLFGNQSVTGTIRGSSLSSSAAGVIGTSPNTAGAGFLGLGSYGVYGVTNNGNGSGVYGAGVANGSTGVFGTGAGYGIYGTTSLPTGVAGAFNVANNGEILSGQNTGTEVFSVASTGAVSTAGSVTIGSGTPIVKHLSQTFSASFPSLKPSTCTSLAFTLTGASDGDTTALGVPNALMAVGNVIYSGWVNATNSVTIRACNVNPNGPATTAASGTVRVDVWKH